jgi:streptomycin 6-kinase
MPSVLVEAARRGGRQAWLATLSSTIEELGRRWSLTVGAPFQPGGQTAWVAPARDAAGNKLVLKVGWQHWEAVHEAEGLIRWDGAGAVRLHAHEELHDTVALLLERCWPGLPLALRPEPEQDVVVAGLLRRLWRAPSSGSFRTLR